MSENKKEKIYLIISPDCPHCETAKKNIEKNNLDVEVLDVTKDDFATKLVMKLKIYEVPTLVKTEKVEGTGLRVCRLNDQFEPESCTTLEEGE